MHPTTTYTHVANMGSIKGVCVADSDASLQQSVIINSRTKDANLGYSAAERT